MAAITLLDIYQIARKAGLDDEGARVAQAIALTEGALSGQVGDNGQSFGPFQFYTGGQLPAFAAALGSSVDHAAQVAQTNPAMAAEWALRGYLGNAIRQGQAEGLSGPQLATYAQANGQVSENPERAGQNYQQLASGGENMSDPFDEAFQRAMGGGSSTDAPIFREGPDGQLYMWDATRGVFVPAPGMPGEWQIEGAAPTTPKTAQYQDPMDGSEWIIDSTTGEKIQQLSPAIPGWTPGRGVVAAPSTPQRAPRYPEEIQLAQLEIQKAQRDLMDPFSLAQQQVDAAIQSIQQRLARGEIDSAEATRLMSLARANIDATLRGATPWQMEQAQQQQKNQQANLASNVLGDRMNVGSSMATGLLSGLGGIYGKILSSANPPTNFDPMLMAKTFTTDMGGGQQLSDMAKAILSGALQQQQGGM